MTEAWSKHRILPLIFIVKSFKKPLPRIKTEIFSGKFRLLPQRSSARDFLVILAMRESAFSVKETWK